MANWIIYSLILTFCFNLLTSLAIFRSTSLGPAQRSMQAVLVWVLPVVGAVIVLSFLAADRPARAVPTDHDPSLHPGDETTMAQGPSPCGCSGSGDGGD